MREILDLFCCSGGAGAGYFQAGLKPKGIDIVNRPRYPHEFVKADAVTYLRDLIDTGEIRRYCAVHASPPCQEGCTLTIGTNAAMGWGGVHEQLIPALRVELERSGLPFIIEQPTGNAPIRKDIRLCGEMFGLGVIRHRYFEIGNWEMPKPIHKPHRGRVRGWRYGEYFDGPYVAVYGKGGGKATISEAQKAMRIDWTDVLEELTEAIPPAYTEHIGTELLRWLDR